MPETKDQTPSRSQADKERSRQQSRAVSGKEAAKGVSGQPGRGQTGPAKGSGSGGQNQGKGQGRPPAKGSGPGGRNQAQGKGQGRPPAKGSGPGGRGGSGPGNRRPSGSRPGAPAPRRSPAALLTWGAVGLVLVIVIVLVIVNVTGSSSGPGTAPASQPLPSTVAYQMTHVPESVYDTVGITSSQTPVTPPTVISGQPPLTFNGQPGVLYVGGEFCPYCAAERWAIVTSMSRFGNFTGLGTMESSSTDIYPSTQTVTFANATFTSPYLVFKTRELYSNQRNSANTSYVILQPLTKTEQALVTKYDTPKYTGGSSTSSGSIPFINFGNKALVSGSSYTPSILQGLSRETIAGGLNDPKNPVTQAIIAASNYLSASTCATDGQKPASVCTSKGVTEAAKAMKLTP